MPNTVHYDVIVLGVGGMGSAAIYHLAKRGKRVLGIERFDIPNAMGSSHGVNRIIRLAYWEHPSYVPLLHRSYTLWRDLQATVGEQLLYITGGIDAGPPDSPLVRGSLRSCAMHSLQHEILTSIELSKRFPAFHVPTDTVAVLQPDAGFVLSERCIVAHVQAALALGAVIHGQEQVVAWEPISGGVRVRTARAIYEAEQLVVTAGAWARAFLPGLAELAVPERQVLGWFQPKQPGLFALGAFPVFLLQVPEGFFYGFPVFSVPGFKLGCFHHLREQVDPDTLRREAGERDEAVLRSCIQPYFPDADGPTMALKVCMFTNTPDEHFIIDRLPDHPQVAIAAGFSGHGFKFCSVVGEILADLVARGATDHDIELFRLNRF
jgi:sarcosine oxidase